MLDVITENIDVWTSAQSPKKSGGRGRNKNGDQTGYGIKKIRELILELAVRGKLVPQDPNDEPASVLLEKIVKEKARLIKEGKIKKQKPLPAIVEDEKLFNLPNGWEIEHLKNLSHFITKGTTPTTHGYSYTDSVIRFVKVENIDKGRITNDGALQFISEEAHDFLARSKLETGDLLFSIAGTIGKTCIIHDEDLPANTNQALAIIRGTNFVFISDFLRMQLDSFVSNKTKARARGGAMNNVSLGDLNELIIYIPPLAEQKRIVTKVDELMVLCDQLEQEQTDNNAAHQTLVETLLGTLTTSADNKELQENWSRIEHHFDILFTTEHSIDQLKQTILQLAVMGKLVPQDPNNEPASVLFEKIARDKARLIEEGEIKKQKKLPAISEDEELFNLPEAWVWARISEIGRDWGQKTPQEDFTYIDVSAIDNKLGKISSSNVLTASEAPSRARKIVKAGTIIYSTVRPYLKNICVIEENYFPEPIASTAFAILHPLQEMPAKFFTTFFRSPIFISYVESVQTGIAYPAINDKQFFSAVLPLPPLAEQHRIVAKVDELISLCDDLKAKINDAQAIQIQLADATVEKAVA